MAEVKEMGKLPDGWKRVRLGDKDYFVIVGSGIDFFKGMKNYLSTVSVQGTKIMHIEDEVSYFNRPSRANMQPKKDRLAFAKMRKTIKVLYIDEKLESNYILSTGFSLLETKGIYPNYVYQYLLSDFFNSQKDRFAEGTTQEAISNDDFEHIFISFPTSFPEQRKIAEILETVDNAIEKTDRIIEKYKRIKQGLMQDLLTKGIDENGQIRSEETHRFKDSPLGRIPEEWEVVELEKVAEPNGIVRGPFGGMLKKEIFVPRGYKVYEQGNAIYKSVKLGNYYIDSKKYKQMLRFAVKPKDFIISCSGTIGKIFMIPDNFEEGIINQALLKITIDDKRFNHNFFEYFFDWDRFQTKIIDYTQGGAMQNLIGINEFKKIGFPKPPLPEQHRIASILSQIDEAIEKEQRYKEKLERIKQGLMEDLLTGKVRVNHLIEGVENVS